MINSITLQILNFFDYFYKRKILSFMKSLKLDNIETIFDIGAHNGETIYFFLKNFNVNQIYAFEASEHNFQKLEENVNSYKNKFFNSKINIENIALGDKIKKKRFKQFSESSSSTFSDIDINSPYFKKKFRFLNRKENNNFFVEKDIDLIPLADYLINVKIDKIDILKIDTEGYEFEILKGLKDRIKMVDIIFFEHHYDDMIKKSYTFTDINHYLKKNNFKKIFRSKMPFRKTFEYIYRNKDNISKN